jgi:two-component system, sensor histidine kinase PdtaS
MELVVSTSNDSSISSSNIECNEEKNYMVKFRYNRILDGINRIFSSVLHSKTVEELGNTCLSVALELTDSKIGFVDIVGDDGIMHDIAISKGGWDQCLMFDQTGHCHPPDKSVLRGLYGHVIKSGKGFFTNNPISFPDSTGTPSGHPQIISFLGVILILDEKMIGVLGVANRESGYSCEQLDDLNAIVPAMTQALQRKKVELEQIKAEEKIKILANAVESSNDAIMTGTLDDIITSWNKGAEQLYGYSAEEALGQSASIIEPCYLKGEIKKFNEKIKRGEKLKNYETVRLKKDGTPINVSVTLSPVFDDRRRMFAFSVIVRDITQRKAAEEKLRESEERYRIVTEKTRQIVYDYDYETDKTIWTGAVEKLTGYLPDYLQNSSETLWISHLHPEDRKKVLKIYDEHLKKGQDFQIEYRFRKKDGGYVYIEDNSTFLINENGKVVRNLGVMKDITKQKQAEEALAKIVTARKKEIHHRIKNNLQVISSLLDLQAEKFDNRKCIEDSEVKEAFRESQDRVISMALIHEELYKGDGADTLDFSSYIDELADNLFHTYIVENNDVRLKLDLAKNVFFDMDTAIPLGMIVNELVSNSLKHAFKGREKGEIRIKLYREKSAELESEGCEGTSFILTVSDDGVGIPESLDLEYPDTLGIQLVTSLVDQLDGELELKKNNGTKFTIRFTIIQKDNHASESSHSD